MVEVSDTVWVTLEKEGPFSSARSPWFSLNGVAAQPKMRDRPREVMKSRSFMATGNLFRINPLLMTRICWPKKENVP